MNLKTLFLIFAICTFSAFAQDMPIEDLPTATLDDNFNLTLDPEAPISSYYFVDISDLDFADEAEAIKKCGYYLTANLISTEVHFSEHYLIVHLYTEYMGGDMDYEKIQTYLSQLTKPE